MRTWPLIAGLVGRIKWRFTIVKLHKSAVALDLAKTFRTDLWILCQNPIKPDNVDHSASMTPDTYVETKTSLRIWGALPFMLFMAIYSGCAEKTTLRCIRTDGVCLLTQETLIKKNEITIKLEDLLGAHKEGSTSGRSSGGQSFLDTRQGPVPFEIWPSNNSANISSSVRRFLDSPKQKELVEEFDRRLDVLGAGSFLLVGSAILFWLSFRAPAKGALRR